MECDDVSFAYHVATVRVACRSALLSPHLYTKHFAFVQDVRSCRSWCAAYTSRVKLFLSYKHVYGNKHQCGIQSLNFCEALFHVAGESSCATKCDVPVQQIHRTHARIQDTPEPRTGWKGELKFRPRPRFGSVFETSGSRSHWLLTLLIASPALLSTVATFQDDHG